MSPLVVIILGPPASGKTTLAVRLGGLLQLPVLSRDHLKEVLFTSLGYSDRAWSRRLGQASYMLLYDALATMLATDMPCIVESNFRADIATAEMLALRDRFSFRPVQVRCWAPPALLYERYRERARSGRRHPGHCDDTMTRDAFLTLIQSDAEWLAPVLHVDGPIMRVDTSIVAEIDVSHLAESIHAMLDRDSSGTSARAGARPTQ